jgi:DNA-binding response OmpR family regulator
VSESIGERPLIAHSAADRELLATISARMSSEPKRVVVIGEDDKPIADLLHAALNEEPSISAVVVSDGALVLETIRQVKAGLLILDIMMPGLNGIEVYDRLRREELTKDLPVLFITAARRNFDRDLRRRGIDDVITKPFDLNDLLRRVHRLLGITSSGDGER